MGNSNSNPSTEVTDPTIDGNGNGPVDTSPAVPVASINCGSALEGHTSNDAVSISGQTATYSDPLNKKIEHPNGDFAAFGRSHRWSTNDFGINVTVPVPGEYDVTLVFCEIYEGAFAAGKRVFDVIVEGTERREFPGVDVYSLVGEYAIHTITIQNMPAEFAINVTLKKGGAENPFISGIVVGPVENPVTPPERPPIPEPEVIVTQEQYDECVRNIDAYIVEKKENPPSEVLNTPTFQFHAPGEKVRGLILTFHGFAQYQYDHRIIGKYLYDLGYDVVHTMLAGHFYGGTEWPQTKLKAKYGGGEKLRETMMSNPELAFMLQEVGRDASKSEEFIKRLAQLNPDFERMMSAEDYMAALDNDEDPNFNEFFDSNHRDYALEGTKYLRMCDAHPGPVHTMGLSVGGTAAIAVAAMNPQRISKCISFAPLLELYEARPNTNRSLVNYISPLGVLPPFSNWSKDKPFPMECFTANGRFGGSLTSSKKFQQLFKNGDVQLFLVLTENEDAADVATSKKFFADCGGRAAGHQYFIYPFDFRVPHPLLDPTRPSRLMKNEYWRPMYQQCYSFLTTGHVDTAPMFKKRPTDDLPQPPREVGNAQYYYGAAQTGEQNRWNV